MPIVISCPNPSCGRRYSVPDDAAGRSATCASCGTKIQITGLAKEPVAAPAPPPPPPDDEPRGRDDDFDDEHEPASVAKRRRTAPAGPGFVDFAMFRWLITPRILILLYWIVVVLIILGGLGVMVSGFFAGGNIGQILGGIVGGILIILVGPVLYRIVFEILILAFRIYDTLIEIRDNTSSEPEP